MTGPGALRYVGLAGSAGVVAAGTRPVGLLAAGVLAAAWLGLRPVHEVRSLLLTAALWTLPLLVVPPLFSQDAGAYACQGQLYLHGLDPYRYGVADLPCSWLDRAPPLWLHTTTPYGPVWIAISGAAAATGTFAGAVGVLRLVALAGIGIVLGYGYRLARTLGTDPSRVVWLGAAAPLVLLHGVAGVHNDALLAGLVVAGLAYAATGRYGLRAGVLLGLAVGVKVTALVAVPFAVSLVARERRLGPLTRATAGVGAGALATFAVASGATGLGLGWVPALSGTATLVQWTSLPTGVGMAAGYVMRGLGAGAASPTALAIARGAGLVALAALAIGLWWRARGPVEAVRGCGLTLAATALLGPVFFPWYALAPLAVLGAAIAWERWIAGTVAVLALAVLPDGRGLASMTKPFGAFFDLALVSALAVAWARRHRAGRARPTPTG